MTFSSETKSRAKNIYLLTVVLSVLNFSKHCLLKALFLRGYLFYVLALRVQVTGAPPRILVRQDQEYATI